VTFVASAVILLGIRMQVAPPLEGAAGRKISGFFTQYVDGLRYLRHHPDVLFISMHKAMNSLFVAGVFQVVQVAIAERVFVIGEGGSTGLGLIYAAIGIGTGLGPILARIFTGDRDRPMRFAIIASYGLSSLGLLIIAPLFDFNSVLIGSLVRGVGAGLMWVFSTQLLLQLTPDQVRGRVFATEFAMLTLASAIGSLLGGWALDQPGVTIAHLLWIPAILNVIPGVLWAVWVTAGKHRHTPSPEAEEAIPAR
jgi:predicted MFS family arabinose efflux permease